MPDPTIRVSDEVRQTVEAGLRAFNAHDLDGWMALHAEDAVHTQPNRAEPLRGREAIRADYLAATWTAFPDFRFELARAFGAGGWVCVEGVFTGTHSGPLASPGGETIPPTGRQVRVPLCMVLRLAGGRIVEVHEYNDQLGFLAQLGLAAAG